MKTFYCACVIDNSQTQCLVCLLLYIIQDSDLSVSALWLVIMPAYTLGRFFYCCVCVSTSVQLLHIVVSGGISQLWIVSKLLGRTVPTFSKNRRHKLNSQETLVLFLMVFCLLTSAQPTTFSRVMQLSIKSCVLEKPNDCS